MATGTCCAPGADPEAGPQPGDWQGRGEGCSAPWRGRSSWARLRSPELGWFCMPGRSGPAWGRVYGACAHTGRQTRAPGVCVCVHACAFHSGPHMPPVHSSGCSRALRSRVFGERGPPLSAFGALAVHPLPTGPGRVPCSRRSWCCWACSAGLTLLGDTTCGVGWAPPRLGCRGVTCA